MNLIINADDFGYTEGSNLAVFSLAEAGSLTSTTVMANMPASESAGKLKNFPNIGIGLHFNLTEGRPVSSVAEVPGLVDESGMFPGKVELQHRLRRKEVDVEQVYRELLAQYERLRSLVGERIDHLDSHQGLNKMRVVNQALLRFGQEGKIGAIRVYNKYYLIKKSGVYSVSHPGLNSVGEFGFRRVLVEAFLKRRTKKLERYFDHPAGLMLARTHNTLDMFNALINLDGQSLHNNVIFEIPCHPSANTEGLENSKLKSQRVDEYKLMMSKPFIQSLQNFLLVNYSACRRVGE